ncbi:nucleotidyltransferase domain-containing protein [Candidatus Woesearchaeota archaeon]|nr:nucleotidyltransferase domain-containing protein [Candidatus Woesearchaeota archaeon]
MNITGGLPFTQNKLEVLLEIYAEGEDYLRNLEKKTSINPSLLHRILRAFVQAQMLKVQQKGKEVYYSFSEGDTPFFTCFLERYYRDKIVYAQEPLRVIIKLLESNKDLSSFCERVYLFGSFVSGGVRKESDIDMLFVSRQRVKIIQWCREASVLTGRTINPLIYTPKQFDRDLQQREALLSSIVQKIKNRVILV